MSITPTYLKKCALGHAPKTIVQVAADLYECPLCGATYRWEGSRWNQISPSLIVEEERRFQIFIESIRLELASILSAEANAAINNLADNLEEGLASIAWAIKDAAKLSTHIRLLEITFNAFSKDARRQMITAAFRIAEGRRRIQAFEAKATDAISGNEALKQLKSEERSIKASIDQIMQINSMNFTNDQINELDRQRLILLDQLIAFTNKKAKLPSFMLMFVGRSQDDRWKKLDDHLMSLVTDLERRRHELCDKWKTPKIAALHKLLDILVERWITLERNLQIEAHARITEFKKEMDAWRQEAIMLVPEEGRPICIELSKFYESRM